MSFNCRGRRSFILFAVAVLIIISGNLAWASTFRFAATGTAVTNGAPENATGTFTINPQNIVVELVNAAGPGQLNNTSSVLSGVTFKLTGGAADGLTILTASAAGAVNCEGGSVTCPATMVPAAPFGWGLNLVSGQYLLAAGDGTLKPDGIVNSNLRGDLDGIKNSPHNPYLLGPATFTVSYQGTAPTGITSVGFIFGTDSRDYQPGFPSVPEPSCLVLSGGALLLALAWRMRRR